jgi:hypothetical protein
MVRWRGLAYGLFLLLLTLLALEGLLRLFPGAIPIKLLRHFDDDLRISIAQRLGMPTRLSFRELPRDDGGPPLYVSLPHAPFPLPGAPPGAPVRIMDERGFCNSPSVGAAPYDEITVGGSISWCVDIEPEQTWTAQLAGLSGLRAYNLSVPGVGPYEYLQVLRRIGLALKPRLVLFDISGGNDLRDVIAYERFRANHAIETDDEGQAALRSHTEGGFVAEHSYLYALIRAWLVGFQRDPSGGKLPADPRLPKKDAIDFTFKARWGDHVVTFNADNHDRDEAFYAKALALGAVRLDGLRPPLEQLAALARERGFTAVVTYTPAAYTVYADVIGFADPSLAGELREFDRRQREFLAATARQLGLAFIDLTPPLQAAAARLGGSELLYLTSNLHFSAAGHRVVAEYLAGALPALVTH